MYDTLTHLTAMLYGFALDAEGAHSPWGVSIPAEEVLAAPDVDDLFEDRLAPVGAPTPQALEEELEELHLSPVVSPDGATGLWVPGGRIELPPASGLPGGELAVRGVEACPLDAVWDTSRTVRENLLDVLSAALAASPGTFCAYTSDFEGAVDWRWDPDAGHFWAWVALPAPPREGTLIVTPRPLEGRELGLQFRADFYPEGSDIPKRRHLSATTEMGESCNAALDEAAYLFGVEGVAA